MSMGVQRMLYEKNSKFCISAASMQKNTVCLMLSIKYAIFLSGKSKHSLKNDLFLVKSLAKNLFGWYNVVEVFLLEELQHEF